ncbi:MAG: C39 family peptidase [Anaerolineales bacterium]
MMSRLPGAAWMTISALAVVFAANGLALQNAPGVPALSSGIPEAQQVAADSASGATVLEPGAPSSATLAGALIVMTDRPMAPTRAPTPRPTERLVPVAYRITGAPAGAQRRRLSCEFQSAADLAWYYGVPLEWDDLFSIVGYSAVGDPQQGFAGASIDDAPGQLYPAGYGVYAEPIVAALRTYGLNAVSAYGRDATWIREMVAADRPVMVWAVAGMRDGVVETWHTTDGRPIEGVRFEHTFLVVGFTPEQVAVLDAYDGKCYEYSWERFLRSWSVLGRMAVIIDQER